MACSVSTFSGLNNISYSAGPCIFLELKKSYHDVARSECVIANAPAASQASSIGGIGGLNEPVDQLGFSCFHGTISPNFGAATS